MCNELARLMDLDLGSAGGAPPRPNFVRETCDGNAILVAGRNLDLGGGAPPRPNPNPDLGVSPSPQVHTVKPLFSQEEYVPILDLGEAGVQVHRPQVFVTRNNDRGVPIFTLHTGRAEEFGRDLGCAQVPTTQPRPRPKPQPLSVGLTMGDFARLQQDAVRLLGLCLIEE